MISILKESFNITMVPTIIVKDEKIEGLTTLNELYPKICKYYKDVPEECENYL